MTTFCCHDQSKMEVSDALSVLCQHNLLEPSVVIVRRYTNTPYIPWGSSHLLYLDVSTLSGGASSAQFPLDWLCLPRLLPFSDTEVVLPWEEGEMGFKVFSIYERLCGKAQKRNTASPTQFHCQSLQQTLIPIEKRVPRWREDWAFNLPLGFQMTSIKLECELV